jgi:hypothetical protein
MWRADVKNLYNFKMSQLNVSFFPIKMYLLVGSKLIFGKLLLFLLISLFYVVFIELRQQKSQALMAHACDPSYSGGRDQEDHSSMPSQTNSSQDPISKTLNTKNGWWSGSRCRP